jgi:hypothetical protein
MVVTLILIVTSIAAPIYRTCAVRAREAVLRDHPFALRALIDASPWTMGAPRPGWKSSSKKAIWADFPPTPSRVQTRLGRCRRRMRPSHWSNRRGGLQTSTAAPASFPSKALRIVVGSFSEGVRIQKSEVRMKCICFPPSAFCLLLSPHRPGLPAHSKAAGSLLPPGERSGHLVS